MRRTRIRSAVPASYPAPGYPPAGHADELVDRADGTRAASLGRTDLDQLLGYALMDYSDAYRLDTVAIYAVRFGYLAAWPLDQLCTQMAGHPVDFATLRCDFAHVLSVQLPAQPTR